MHEGKVVQGYVTQDYWTDIGNLQQYQQANYDALAGRARLEIPGTLHAPGIWVGENFTIHPEARLEAPVVLGRNVVVEAGAVVGAESVVGNATIIGKHAHFERSVSWSDCYVGETSVVSGQHDRRPQHHQRSRHRERGQRDRERLHDRKRCRHPAQHQTLAG